MAFCSGRAQELRQRRARLGLTAFQYSVFKVDGNGVGLAGKRLGEQFGPCAGHEQLAAYQG